MKVFPYKIQALRVRDDLSRRGEDYLFLQPRRSALEGAWLQVIHDAQYDNKEERRVITGSEAKTAKSNHEALRRNHRGRNYKTTSPISTKSSKYGLPKEV